jgi:hypothetical protein
MPKRTDLQSIRILGSGSIVIGQAAEFDYSGTLLNPSPRGGWRGDFRKRAHRR